MRYCSGTPHAEVCGRRRVAPPASRYGCRAVLAIEAQPPPFPTAVVTPAGTTAAPLSVASAVDAPPSAVRGGVVGRPAHAPGGAEDVAGERGGGQVLFLAAPPAAAAPLRARLRVRRARSAPAPPAPAAAGLRRWWQRRRRRPARCASPQSNGRAAAMTTTVATAAAGPHPPSRRSPPCTPPSRLVRRSPPPPPRHAHARWRERGDSRATRRRRHRR